MLSLSGPAHDNAGIVVRLTKLGHAETLNPAVPQRLSHAPLLVLITGHDKQRVGQPVQIGDDVVTDRLLAGQGDDVTLCPATDRPRHVQVGRRGRANAL